MHVYPFLNKFNGVIDTSVGLSDKSKVNYKNRLGRLVTITGKDVDWIIDHCVVVLKKMKENGLEKPESTKAYINTILALFKYTEKLKEKKPKAYKCWLGEFTKVNEIAMAKYNNLAASDKQVASFVAWEDILQKRDDLNRDSIEYLLLCMYTMIPPSRADMNHIKIFNREPSEKESSIQPNYLVIGGGDGSGGGMRLVYNEFKSKNKNLLKYEKELPMELVEVIKRSLKVMPREYLFVSSRNGQPFVNPNSYTKFVHRILEKVIKKGVTINTLRHSFVMSLDFNRITPLEKERIAKELMHSVPTMERYRLLLPADESVSGVGEQVCELVCKAKDGKARSNA